MSREAVRRRLREDASAAAEAALAAVEPAGCVREALRARPPGGPCRVLALGKAAAGMVEGALEALGPALRGGVAVVPASAELPAAIGPVRLLAAAHPLPDESSARAGRALLAEAAALGEDELALVLLSGGASALAALPIDGSSVEELAGLSAELLRSGAGIGEINRLRAGLSQVHAGGLSRALGHRPARTLAISDVPGDRAEDIGSAPMHESAPAGEREFEIIATGRSAASAAADQLGAAGYLVELDAEALTGSAGDEALASLRRLRASGSGARALIRFGEPSIRVSSPGAGGRCSHAALAAARALSSTAAADPEVVFLACATDGRDGCSGSGGALVDPGSWARAAASDREPAADLEGFDSGLALSASGDLRPERDSGTNVADLWLALRDDCDDRLVPLEESRGLSLPRSAMAASGAMLVRGELRRQLLAAAARSDGELAIARAWAADEPAFSAGGSVQLLRSSPELVNALTERGLQRDPLEGSRWSLARSRGKPASPSWMRAPEGERKP